MDEELELTLINYSEWLDENSLLAPTTDKDVRSHEQLVREFWASRAG